MAGALVTGALVSGAFVPCADAETAIASSVRTESARMLLARGSRASAGGRRRCCLRDVRLNLERCVEQTLASAHACVLTRGWRHAEIHRRDDAGQRADVVEELRDAMIRAGDA